MKKNIARLILIPYIVSVCFPVQSSFAGSFDLTLHAGDTSTDGVNWNSSVSSIKPGQYVRMTSKVTNNTSVTATTPQLNFSNAAGDTNYTKMGVTATTPGKFYTTAGYSLGTTGAGFNPPVQNFGTFPQDLPVGAFGSAYQYAFQIGTAYTQPTFVPTVFFSAGGVANSSTANFTINVDVKPHIRSVSFSNSSIPNDTSVSTDLTVTVRDWNGCANLLPGAATVTADLRALKSTYTATEALSYISCDAPSSTATFRKTGIVADPTAVIGANTITIAVKDNDNNIGGPSDATFWNVGWNAGDTNTQTITVNSSTGPIPALDTGPTPALLGTSGSSTITWHSDKQPGTYEVRVGGTSCANGTLLATGSITSTAVGSLSATIQATSLVSGANTIYLCATDLVANTGLVTASITKDTTDPTTAIVSWTPSTVATENVNVTWNASEAGNYVIQVNGVDLTGGDGTNVIGSYTSGDVTSTINNTTLVNGANTIRVKFTDTAGNGPVYSTNSATPYKDLTPPLPPQSVTLADCDYIGNTGTPCAALGNPKNGVTGRDFYVNFVLPTETGSIQEYDIYAALSGQVLTSTSTILARVYQNQIIGTSTGVWIGDNITADSNGVPFITSGTGLYYVSIKSFKSNGLYSLTSTDSTGAIITHDTVTLPVFSGASFTSNTGITLTYSKTLTGTLSAYNMSRLSSSTSCFAFDTSSGTGALSVTGSTVTFKIQPLNNVAKTCSDLTIGSGAITDSQGLYNEQILDNQSVTDGQIPSPITISAPGNNLFVGGNGAFTFTYNFPENMSTGSIVVRFIDGLSNVINYPLPTYSLSGSHSVTLTGSVIGLVDGQTYSLKILANDVAGNAGISPTVTGLVYDITPPTAPIPSLPTAGAFINTATPTLTWIGSTDNYSTAGNLRYTIEVSTALDFSSILESATAISGTSFTLLSPLVTNTGYYWRIKATDEASNTGSYSSTGTFTFDNTLPVISTLGSDTYVDNTTRSFTGYVKNTDTAVLHAKITDNFQSNMTPADISANLSSLGGGTAVNPTGYVVGTGLATWAGITVTCTDGIKNIPITATDRAGNVGNYTATVVCDNTAPNVIAGTFTSPAAAGYLSGGTLINVDWDTNFYSTEASPIASPITLEYATDGGTVWTPILTDAANSGTTPWTPPSVDINNAKLRLTAKDKLSNTASATITFTIDSTNPSVGAAAITSPNGGEFLKGSTGTGITITWNPAVVTDTNIATNPIALEYSINSGGAWTSIATGLANNGSYLWNPIPVPARDIGTVRIRLIASDKVSRTGSDTSDADFTIDSTNPVTTISSPTTPPNNSYINDSGFDIGAVATDTNIDKGYYSFSYGGLYWNGGGWLGTPTWNQLCNSAGSCNPINTTVTPGPIIDGTTYSLTLRGIDKAGNLTDSSTYTFVGDTVAPLVSTTTQSGSYFSGAVSLAGTGSDNRSGIASVTVQIQRQTDNWYYDGVNFVNTGAISLLTNTSNSYANWTYTGLTLPPGDADGTQYFITYTAIDNAYKVNNTTSHTITIIKDATGPTVAAGVWTNPLGGEIWNGGTVKTLTWDPTKITDTVSGVNTVNGIIIEYSTGGIWNTVANGISNSGSYDWTLPYPLDASVTLRISARDYVGNLGAGGVSNAFSIDSIPPTIQTVETVGNGAGKIEGLRVTFSENINTAGVNTANFSYSPTTAIALGYTIVNSQTIELLFSSATGTTALTGTLTYSGTSIHDVAANLLAPTSKTVVDKASPVITNTVVRDNNSNGKIDQILVTWSENIASTTDTTAWTLVNPLSGMGVAPTGVSVTTNVVTLTLAEPTAYNTSSGGVQLSFTANANYKDTSVSANLAGSVANLSLTDGATPIVTSVATFDNSGLYAIDVNFSETITGATLSGFTLSGTSTYTGTIVVVDSDTLRLVTTDSINTAKTFTLSYNGVGIYLKDAANNYLANFSAMAVTDAIAPKILTRTTLDTNGNGHIDGIRIGFSEALAGTTLGTTVTVAGYVVTGYSVSGTGLTATLTEGVNADTSITPLVQLQNTTLTDAVGNIVASEVSPTAALDAVGPVVTNVRFDGTDKLYATFSENIVGAFTPASFVLSGATATINSVSITSGSSTGTLTLSDNGITYGSSELSFANNSVGDALSNKQTALSFVQISASVIINEVMWSSTGSSATQYIELHNLGSTSIDISGWTIDHAVNSGIDILTIPAVQTIAANGYYLITSTATNNANNLINDGITADYAGSLSITPAQAGDLVLKNGATVFDQAKANPWPVGDNDTPASMERKSIPGNGLTASNWYIAQTGVGFDAAGPFGTPRTVNVFDSTPPTITSSSPASNTLFPMGVITLDYTYTDAGGITPTPTYTFLLEKNNGAGVYSDVTAASVSSSGITASAASFTTNALAFGAYRATFTITDAAGNTTQDIVAPFFVDNFQMTISTGAVNIGALSVGALVTSTDTVTVTVKTVGAGFDLSLGGDSTMQAGVTPLQAWNAGQDKGFGFDWTESGISTKAYDGFLTAIAPTQIATYALSPEANGNQKTYTFAVKYGAKIDALQAAGIYQASPDFRVNMQY